MSGRESSWQTTVSVENFHRSARIPPATRSHAGHIRINHDSAGHSPTSRLCRLPDIVPKDYLQKNGYPDRGDYNQVANFALTETSINIGISNKPPMRYMAEVATQVESGLLTLGELTDPADLAANLAENAIPAKLAEVTAGSYREFLVQRRRLMAAVIREHYRRL